MFRGHSCRSLDTKGRLMLPPEIREAAIKQEPEGRLVLTNFDGCVAAYPLPEWEQIEASFQNVNKFNRKFRDFQRFFISGATEVNMDKQWRILIPPHLRSYAGLEREVVLAGVGKKFEIWDLAQFEDQRKQMEEDFDAVMDELSQEGFELFI